MHRVRIVAGLCLALAALADAGHARAADLAPGQSLASPEEQLAARYAPVLYIARQRRPCDPAGDPFDPAPVEVVLDDPAVAL
jgi:hypothetical protein